MSTIILHPLITHPPPGLTGSQMRAERLAHDVLYDINNWAQGWIDWNLLVDSKGGPNHQGNVCDAPLVTNVNFTDINVQPKYYYFGQIRYALYVHNLYIDRCYISTDILLL